MSRKNSSFGQLIKYMNKEGDREKAFDIFHNIYAGNDDYIAKEFKTNSEFLKERKNGNMFYHEMISVTKSKSISIEQQKEILCSLVKDYIQLRAKNNLVYGVMHTDKKDNLHYHLMISSNEFQSEKKHRLAKSDFAKIQKEIEKYVLNNYPQMEQKIIYNQQKDEKTKSGEFELKRRTGKESQRDNVKSRLKEVFEKSKTKQDFFQNLADKNFDLYIHGNTIGVTCKETNKNYRFKTLGLLDDFYKISPTIQEAENRKEEIKKSREEFKKEKVDTRSYRSASMKEEERVPTKEERKNKADPFQTKDEVYYSEAELEIQKRKEEIRKSKEGNSKDYSNEKMR